MKRIRLLSVSCLLLCCLCLGILILQGSFLPAVLYPFAALGLLGCAGLFFTGLYELFLWIKARHLAAKRRRKEGAAWKRGGFSF
ncbi:MAG: hypothetical protein HFG27_00105 [Provencibacterium sp.]|jgi:hypothetical protein|nr:hypothetical protein [Provencibacterium sp.]